MMPLTTQMSPKVTSEAKTKPEAATNVRNKIEASHVTATWSPIANDDKGVPQHLEHRLRNINMGSPLTAPATPNIMIPTSEEENSLCKGGPNVKPTGDNFTMKPDDVVRHNPTQNLPMALKNSFIPDTPLSLSPNVQEHSTMSDMIAYCDVRSSLEASPHAESTHQEETTMTSLVEKNEGGYKPVFVDHGRPIGLAEVVAVSKHGVHIDVQDMTAAIKRVSASVDALQDKLHDGHSIYGITTGFGGSANTRTRKTYDLQRALLQHQQSGILPVIKESGSIHAKLRNSPGVAFMPEEWVRGAMLVRCKSLLNGHSAIRWELIVVLMTLLNANLVPLVPLRGSISASGDLQPLSYIAGAMEGNPDIWVWTDDGNGGRDLISSDVALAKVRAVPQTFGPKEGLAVLNGTAFSTAVAALALHEANNLAVLSQVLTAMGTEALLGAVGNFDPFFAKVRPHKGQAEAARNIRHFIQGSALARNEDDGVAKTEEGSLAQDRYSLRTASQWIGPQLEDLALANVQISVECNSTTDNPLFDIEDHTVHHGGNFQAASVTSAMEKTRLSLQMFGRMLFSQCTELINPATNNGLPGNLAADEPSTSYTYKGTDINVAAYMSELAYLANPVSSHVQTAEMGNQAINSLALISARYTHQAIDVLSMICASYLYSLCQALDLRVMNLLFVDHAIGEIRELTYEAFEYALINEKDKRDLQANVVKHIIKQIPETTSLDSGNRFQHIADSSQGVIFSFLGRLDKSRIKANIEPFGLLREWNVRCSERLKDLFVENRKTYLKNPNATQYLGKASRKMYSFIRTQLKVPFNKGLVDCPTKTNESRTVGSNVSVIYEALRGGPLYQQMMELLQVEGHANGESTNGEANQLHSESWESTESE